MDDAIDYDIQPGAYTAIFTDGADADLVGIAARRTGLVLKDTFLVVEPDRTSLVLLFKQPSGKTVAEDAEVGVAMLHIDACRVGDYRNPMAFEGYERTSQVGNWGMRASKARVGEASAEPPPPDGRWPPNVALIEGPFARKLDEVRRRGNPDSAARFYPRFRDIDELKAWFEKLLTGHVV
jgi:hypothetical protein